MSSLVRAVLQLSLVRIVLQLSLVKAVLQHVVPRSSAIMVREIDVQDIPPCERARELLMAPGQKVEQQSENTPGAAPDWYIKNSTIKAVFQQIPVRTIFLCPCTNCVRYADLPRNDNRKHRFDKDELLNKYANIYALLIYLRYAGLISIFRQYLKDWRESYLTDHNLRFLDDHSKLTPLQSQIIRSEILRDQYRFLLRTFVARKEVTNVDVNEALAIKESAEPIGKGDFGEVFEVDIPEEYMDDRLKETVRRLKTKKLARKIFDKRRTKASGAREWWNYLWANGLENENLMPALAAFQYGNYFFILFELAESTLSQFLESDSTAFTSQGLWKQVSGLASGLAYLHGKSLNVATDEQPTGKLYHLDLKPANVLIVNGVMKIADFGLSRYKEDPRMFDSSSSRPFEGINNYSPPPGNPASEGYDMFSLGSMISEIACFDIGKKERLAEYRARREQDLMSQSRNFFNWRTYELKESVIQEHKDLFALAENGRRTPDADGELEAWQKHFYRQELFDLIERMLQDSHEERPAADLVVADLEEFSRLAENAVRTNSQELIEWHEELDELVTHDPPSPENQLIAYWGNTRCRLWLYPSPRGKTTVTIRRYYLQRGLNHLELPGGSFKAIQPLYLDSASAISLRLISREHSDSQVYRFDDLRQALRFQSIMTGKHVYDGMSLELTRVSYPKASKSGLFRKEIQASEKIITERAYLQIWTNYDFTDETDRETDFDINLVILTSDRIWDVELARTLRPKSDEANVIGLPGVQMGVTEIPEGIPLMVPKCNSYKRYNELLLYPKDKRDVNTFWQNLSTVQRRRSSPGNVTSQTEFSTR